MPAGIPVATFAIGEAGAVNAALFAAAVLGTTELAIEQALDGWRQRQTQGVAEHPDSV
jgi:5-(carboxyamino)imidazole ribonucleotide mutase